MNWITDNMQSIVTPVLFVLGGIIIGYIFEKVVMNWLKIITRKTKWEGDDIIINGIKGTIWFWFILAGVYFALENIELADKVKNIADKTILVTVILSATFIAAKIISKLVTLHTSNDAGVIPGSSILTNIVKILIYVIGVIIILQSLGISIAPMVTALGIGGLAVALALQETLSNLFSGLQTLAAKKIKPGDYIKLSTGEEGYVTDITWRYTTIRQLPNNIIIIPNSLISSAYIINYDLPDKEMAVLVQVGVSYDSDLEKVQRVTIEVGKEIMKEVKGGIPDFEPFIRYHTFNDFSIDFTVILRCKEFVDNYLIKHEFVKKLHKRYNQEGIEIPFPIRTVHMNEGTK